MSTDAAYWAAERYQTIAARLHPISEALCDAAGLRATERVLDVATATGNAALAAARRACRVTAIDLDPGMIAVTSRRAATERLAVTAQTADAQQLPFPDASFDAVISTYGVMFAPDPPTAARELLRVCRPGGRIALANWPPGRLIHEMFEAIRRHDPHGADLTPAVTAWGTENGLRTLFPPGRGTRLVTHLRHIHVHAASSEAWTEDFITDFGPAARRSRSAGLYTDLRRLFTAYDESPGPGARIRHDYLEAVLTLGTD